MRKGGILAALLLLAPAASQAKTLEELLVEKGVITRAEAAKTAESMPARVYYNEGTRVEFPDAGFMLKINTLIQTRYSYFDESENAPRRFYDAPASFNGVNNTRVNRSSFDVHRARLYFSGSALHNEFLYMLEGDFVGTANDNWYDRDLQDGRKEPNLKDAYVVWQPCEGFGTQLGQFRTFISRQWNTHDAKLQFPDRTFVSSFNDLGRQQGAAQHATFADGLVTASAGIFNGTSDFENTSGFGSNASGFDTNHSGQVALRVNPTGKMDVYEEGDVNNTDELATSIGAAWAFSEAHNTFPGVGRQEDFNATHLSVDANVKFAGASLSAEYFHQDGETEHSGTVDYATNGGYVQGGFFVLPKELEIAGRYGYLDCDDGAALGLCTGLDKVNEAGAVVNYYWWRHQMKAQLAYTFINEDPAVRAPGSDDEWNSNRWIFQVSAYF